MVGPPDDNDGSWPDNAWMSGRSADEWLAERTARALRTDPLVRGTRLEILVQNGVIILSGELSSAGAREAAGRRAWTVPGVVDVCNRLTVT
jgi:osmotically-inducible protein OsmY